MILNALDHTRHRADVVRFLLVVSYTMETPPRRLRWGHRFQPALDNGVLQWDSFGFQHLPLCRFKVQGRPRSVVVVSTVEDEEVEGCRVGVIVVEGGLIRVVGRRCDGGPSDVHEEVDSILVRGFPFQDVVVRADLVRGISAGEDEAVIAVQLFHGRNDGFEHLLNAVSKLRSFIFHSKRAMFDFLWETGEQTMISAGGMYWRGSTRAYAL